MENKNLELCFESYNLFTKGCMEKDTAKKILIPDFKSNSGIRRSMQILYSLEWDNSNKK